MPLARELFVLLDIGRVTLVHGDFHHQNILDAGDRYVAIDPQPFLGEPEFDVPPWLGTRSQSGSESTCSSAASPPSLRRGWTRSGCGSGL